jgi:peptidoglycan/xylan/chitin deacetylase (PgdA/CDA1 family)
MKTVPSTVIPKTNDTAPASVTATPALPVLPMREYETPPPRAIVVEEAPSDTPSPSELAKLPHVLPADAKVQYSGCEVRGQVISITFDDGPHPEYTPRLLDMLKERGIKATFFMVGKNAQAYPKVVQRIAAEGHEVANHSWAHPVLSQLNTARVDAELQKTHDAIVAACGVAPTLYRPPYGAIRMTQKKHIRERFGYPTVLWDVDPDDWKHPRTQQKVYNRILAQTRRGSIILCHDIHPSTVEAMPETLDELTKRGYQFVTTTQLINLESQTKAAAMPVQVAANTANPATVAPAPVGTAPSSSPTAPQQAAKAPVVSPTVLPAEPAVLKR